MTVHRELNAIRETVFAGFPQSQAPKADDATVVVK
jgi:hypothetical protein